jgi:glycosyltransferase involved in cell wall biosynthesis
MRLLVCTQAVDLDHPILAFFHGWVEEYARHFDEVHVICLQKGRYDLPSHVHVYSLGKEEGENKLKYLFRFFKIFSQIFFQRKVDFVFYHMGAIYNILGAPFFILRHIYKTKFYWWKAHGYINTMGKIALLFVDDVFTSTESGFALPSKKKHVIGQAIDTTFFTGGIDGERAKKVIFVGRIMKVKHIEDFIETAALLLAGDPELRFEIIGPVGDEAYFSELKKRIGELGIGERLTFVGAKNQHELISIYQSASIFLNTSLTHSMDKTVLEGILCGCIPVTGNRAFTDLLGEEGLYIEEPTPEQYAEKIKGLLESDLRPTRMRLREKVVSLHSLNTFTNRIFGI